MNPMLQQLQAWLGPNAKAVRSMVAPLVVVMILAMMVLPLPPFALDLLFTFNIAMALMVMMVAAYMVKPLDFAAFPSVILLTTLLRLSLNVASTRVVLLEGHTGPGAAGAVIRDLAKDSKVPVLQAPVLARALYAHAELDREIPAALFAAVAQVLACVDQLRAALAGQVAMPNALPELNVPDELDPHHKPVPDMEIFD